MAYKYAYNYDEEEKAYKPPVLKTDRNVWKLILFSILTCGFYNFVFFIPLSFDIDKVAPRRDCKKTMNYLFAWLGSLFTLSIVMDIWYYSITKRIQEALGEREISYDFDTKDFWCWFVLGSFIIVGPFIYYHKLCTAMNLLCEDYNNQNSAANK